MAFFYHVGRYSLLMYKTFSVPQRWKLYLKQTWKEMEKLGAASLPITLLIAVFIGAIMTMQTQMNTENPLLPRYTTGLVTRDTLLLEFCSSILCLILAGKVGSSIASEIGTMRITEQLDALDIMGVNSANYLIMPKITAGAISFPVLCCISIILGIGGGWIVGDMTGEVPSNQFTYGLQFMFQPFYIVYTNIKIFIFGILITSISSYYGYYAKGGSLQVGQASTQAVVKSSIVVLLFNLLLTSLL